MRVHRDGGTILNGEGSHAIVGSPTLTNPVVIEDTTHGWTQGRADNEVLVLGSGMTELNGRYFKLTYIDPSHYSLVGEDGTDGRTTGAGGTVQRVLQVDTDYAEADVHKIQHVQHGDKMYLTCDGYRPAEVTRGADDEWHFLTMRFAANLELGKPIHYLTDANPVQIFSYAHGYSTGDEVYIACSAQGETNDRYYTITWLHANYFSLDGEDGTGRATALGGGTVARVVPEAAGASDPLPIWAPPFQPLNNTSITMYYTAGPPATVTSSEDFFTTDMLYDYIKLQESTIIWCYLEIIEVVSATVVNVSVMWTGAVSANLTGAGNATVDWAMEAFTPTNGYPQAVGLSDKRLWLGGTEQNPLAFWGSLSDGYDNFTTSDQADDSLLFTIALGKKNRLQWFAGSDPMVAGSLGSEMTIEGIDPDVAISAGNIRVRQKTTYGSKATVAPVEADGTKLFVQRAGRKLRELTYDFQSDKYLAPNLLRLAKHISDIGIEQLVFQQEPLRLVWARMTDGTLAAMVYERAEDVAGWATITPGGTDVAVESMAVIPSTDETSYEIWLVVSRTINGATKRYIEFMRPSWSPGDDIEDSWFLDCALKYDGAATETITGAYHLIGETVKVFADGVLQDDKVVDANGEVALDEEASVVLVGLDYEARMQTLNLETGSAFGISQGKKRSVPDIVVRLYQTGEGLWYGSDFDDMDELEMRDLDDLGADAVPVYDGDTDPLTMPGGFEQEARVAIKHILPYACTIVALFPDVETEGG
jgi:hypothetical protein